MTLRSPSRISRSLRLSSNFLICAEDGARDVSVERRLRRLPADCAASSVRSRAIHDEMSESAFGKTNCTQDVPASSMEDILDIVSMITRGSCEGHYDLTSKWRVSGRINKAWSRRDRMFGGEILASSFKPGPANL